MDIILNKYVNIDKHNYLILQRRRQYELLCNLYKKKLIS